MNMFLKTWYNQKNMFSRVTLKEMILSILWNMFVMLWCYKKIYDLWKIKKIKKLKKSKNQKIEKWKIEKLNVNMIKWKNRKSINLQMMIKKSKNEKSINWKIEKLIIEKLKNWKFKKLKNWKIEKLKSWKVEKVKKSKNQKNDNYDEKLKNVEFTYFIIFMSFRQIWKKS